MLLFPPFQLPDAPRRPKKPPRSPQDGPRGPQDGPKTAPEGPKKAPRRPNRLPRRPKRPPRRFQGVPRRATRTDFSSPRPQEPPRRPPRNARERPQGGPQEGPTRLPGGFKTASKRPQRDLPGHPKAPLRRMTWKALNAWAPSKNDGAESFERQGSWYER